MIRHMHGCWRGNDKHSRAIAMDRIYFPAKRNTIVALKSCLFTSRKKINIFPLSKLSYAIGGCKVERRAWTFPWWFGTTRIKFCFVQCVKRQSAAKFLPYPRRIDTGLRIRHFMVWLPSDGTLGKYSDDSFLLCQGILLPLRYYVSFANKTRSVWTPRRLRGELAGASKTVGQASIGVSESLVTHSKPRYIHNFRLSR